MENIMIYALNVFNLSPEKENDYKEYSIKAGKIIYSKGGKVYICLEAYQKYSW
jgi:hypothetical protein